MGAAIVAGDDLKILMPRAAVMVFVLDPCIRKANVPIVVRQLVFPRPTCNLFRLTVRPAVAVLLAAIALVQEPLIVAIELVVEDDASNPTALAAETFLDALVGAIDVGIMRQLARLSDTGVEGLAGLVGAVVTLVAVGLEQVTSAVRQRDGAIVRAERARPNQSLSLEMPSAPTRTIGIVAQVMQISLGHNPKGADGPQHAALGAVDLIDTVALPNRSAFASTWQVEVFREHVTRVEILIPIAIARAAAATDVAVPSVLTIALAIPGVVPVPHFRFDFSANRCSRMTRAVCFTEYGHQPDSSQPIVGLFRLASGGVGM